MGLYTVFTIICGIANSLPLFFVFRILQGVASSAGKLFIITIKKEKIRNLLITFFFSGLFRFLIGMAVGGGSVADLFKPAERGRAMSIFMLGYI